MNIKVLSRKQSCSPQLKGILLPAVTGLGFFPNKDVVVGFYKQNGTMVKMYHVL